MTRSSDRGYEQGTDGPPLEVSNSGRLENRPHSSYG